ncbi:MAG: iron ABC transporter permease [Deltaproteobacteria bacterium]|nr:iron ABC transporter permease [Deltaproteobacteria bacterium]
MKNPENRPAGPAAAEDPAAFSAQAALSDALDASGAIVRRPGGRWLLPALALSLLAAMVLSLLIGRYHVPAGRIAAILLDSVGLGSSGVELDEAIVVRTLRLPRVLTAVLSGMGLALAGAAMQGVFRNPLVGPEILGVSSGASFGGALALSLGFSGGAALIPFAFLFGCGALALAFLLSRLARQSSTLGLVLAGVVVGGLFGALTGAITFLADPETKLPGLVYWLLGSFAEAGRDGVAFLAATAAVAGVPLLGLAWRLNVLSLGDSDAAALGLNVTALRWVAVTLAALFVAAQVAVSGGVAWVGLVIPHLGRMLVGPDHVRLLPTSALLGGLYLLLMDTLARTVAVHEIPIGLLTSLIGAPVFAFFFVKLRGRGWSHD